MLIKKEKDYYKIEDANISDIPVIDLKKAIKRFFFWKRKIILELSGGGIRGIMAVYIMAVLEKCFPSILKKQTKIVWCCSTGSIIALLWVYGLASPDSGWNFQKILEWYIEKCHLVFTKNNKFDILNSTYNVENFQKMLTEIFGDIRLLKLYQKTGIEVNIRVVNATLNKPEVWNYQSHPNVKVRDAIRASSAAPFYFSPFRYKNKVCLDGGTGAFACNLTPAVEDLLFLKKKNPNKYFILSIGTGRNLKSYDKYLTKSDNKINIFKWYLNYIREESSFIQEQKIEKYKKLFNIKIYRWNIDIPEYLSALDDINNVLKLVEIVD